MSGVDGFEPEGTISLDSESELPGDSGQFDLTAYAVALAFNSVALPPGMSEAVKAAVAAKATDIREQIRAAAPLDETSEAGASDKRRKDADERAETQVGFILQVQQREREEWARSSVTVAGTTMTGAGWQELSHRLREDDDFRERLLRLYLKRGMSQEEAEARVERVAEIAEIAAIPKSQRTEEQRQTMKNAEADPSFKKDVEGANELQADELRPPSTSTFNQRFSTAASGVSADQSPVANSQSVSPTKTVQIEAAPV